MKTLIILALLITASFATEPTKEELTEALRADPKDSSALYNLGLLNYLEGNYDDAVKHWKALKSLEPLDWQIRAKLIQAYWGAGQEVAANSEITKLREAWQSGKYKDLTEKKFFICDQFQVGKVRAFVLEYYELEGQRPLAWKFMLKSEDDSLDHHLSVGSYPTTTEVARANGTIGPKDRIYHLDGYGDDGSHQTYGFYTNRPDYQKIREEVRRIISGDQKAISSMTPEKPKGGPASAPESKTQGKQKAK